MDRTVVVAAVIYNPSQDQILLARRPAHKHQGNLWEFPGGKVESGERHTEALRRELAEELNISVSACEPLMQIRHDYFDKSVELNVWQVTSFDGTPRGLEGQVIRWVPLATLRAYKFPAANAEIVERICQSLDTD